MMTTNDEKRGIEEMYVSATTSSNLRVEADRPSDADVIIAAGWSQARIGGALLRLHSEWDRVQKPRMAAPEAVKKLAESLTFDQLAKMRIDLGIATIGGMRPSHAVAEIAAEAQARAWFMNEMARLIGELKALPDVRTQVTLQLLKWRVENAEAAAVDIIRWWLTQICPACAGTKWQLAAGTNRQNGKACKACHGVGTARIPHEQVGRRCANWLDQCVERARARIGQRLSGWEKSGTRYTGPD